MYRIFGDLYGKYIYNSNINEAVEISDMLFDYIHAGGDLSNKDNIDESLKNEYVALSQKGMFISNPHNISYPCLNYLDTLLGRMVSKMMKRHLVIFKKQMCSKSWKIYLKELRNLIQLPAMNMILLKRNWLVKNFSMM